MSDSLNNQLNEVLRSCINRFDSDVEMSPALLASLAMKEMDERNESPVLVAYSSNMNLRQIARTLLRKEFDPIYAGDGDNQIDMFNGLQDRYPCKRNGDFVYVLRKHMSKHEREYNISRLRKEAEAKTQHADALQAETEALDAEGFFSQTA